MSGEISGKSLTIFGQALISSMTIDRSFRLPPVDLVDASTINTDASLGNYFRCESTGDRTLAAPTNPEDGMVISWKWKNLDSVSRTLTLATGHRGFRFGSDITGTTATPAGTSDYITAIFNAGEDRWDVRGYIKGFFTTGLTLDKSDDLNQWGDELIHPIQSITAADTIRILSSPDVVRIGRGNAVADDVNLMADAISVSLA